MSDIHRVTRKDGTDMATKIRNFSTAGSYESGNSTLHRMNRDWEDLSRDLRAEDHVAVWAQQHHVFEAARTPQDVVDRLAQLLRSGEWELHDQAMGVLLSLARTDGYDGQLAWRVAVRILLPKAILMAKTQLRVGIEWDDIFSTVISALFEVVGTYPLERRPRGVFANLSMDTLALAQATLADDFDNRAELRRIADSVEPIADARPAVLLASQAPDPHVQASLAELLVRAAELELVQADEPELMQGAARTELLALVTWAVDIQALSASDARRISEYYLRLPEEPDAGRVHRTTRSMGPEGARLRQRASRAVRPLREAALGAYLEAA
ncbi:hypothetical protein OG689_44445 [Kitasatospora sp. NBC_00240]|uniref:hypothetical protein n=1 Tax=Kitasatospora sp. NBC_00240 TaxID=2903567 RepID=UPI0022590CB5|nr:hypothetical protein [Kitasatospora sp. NBC_00240]MCX5216189.1 hypothetical protein [Kitasatospora sp. NBC_00240]